MGKASQAKKAARLAREGGHTEQRPKRRLAFPIAVAAAIVVGVIVVAIARQPKSAPKITIDPTSATTTAVPATDSTVTTVAAGGESATSTTVPTTAAANQ